LYCANCGTRIGTANFCPNCGAQRVEPLAAITPELAATTPEQPATTPDQPPWKRQDVLVPVAVVIGSVAAIIALVVRGASQRPRLCLHPRARRHEMFQPSRRLGSRYALQHRAVPICTPKKQKPRPRQTGLLCAGGNIWFPTIGRMRANLSPSNCGQLPDRVMACSRRGRSAPPPRAVSAHRAARARARARRRRPRDLLRCDWHELAGYTASSEAYAAGLKPP
jgi:hypothetical protein